MFRFEKKKMGETIFFCWAWGKKNMYNKSKENSKLLILNYMKKL